MRRSPSTVITSWAHNVIRAQGNEGLVKFSINQESNNLLEKYTDPDGHTGSFEINPGTYEINIYNKNIEIGNIKINIS